MKPVYQVLFRKDRAALLFSGGRIPELLGSSNISNCPLFPAVAVLHDSASQGRVVRFCSTLRLALWLISNSRQML